MHRACTAAGEEAIGYDCEVSSVHAVVGGLVTYSELEQTYQDKVS